jgi:hypothetical protein
MKGSAWAVVGRLVLAAALALCADAVAGEATDGASDRNLQTMNTSNTQKTDAVSRLEAAYGGPSQAGFGSAVFHETLRGEDELTQAALSTYRTFVGPLWERYGERAWMGPWKEVYARAPGVAPDITAEMRSLADPDARLSVPMILDNIEEAETARAALSAAFDDPAVSELRAFNLGDGEAMSGLLVAGRRGASGEATFLVFLMD